MEDRFDLVGSAKFVTKEVILKGYWLELEPKKCHQTIVFLFCNVFWRENCSRNILASHEQHDSWSLDDVEVFCDT